MVADKSHILVQRIAVLRALYLGDLLCAVPAFRALRRRFPAAEITLIGLPWAADLVARLPYIDRLLPFPGYAGITEAAYDPARTADFMAAARAAGYDLALQMHGDGSITNGFVAELGARTSLGYRRGADERLRSTLPYRSDEHEIQRWLRLVDVLGAPIDDWSLEFPIRADEHAQAAALLDQAASDRPLIGVHAGAKDAARRWPPERFAALADTLAEQTGARIVLTGGASEREITRAVSDQMRSPALDLAGQTDLGTFAAVLSRLDLLVTNDTGASHLAAATGTQSVVLFGPTRPEHWAPLDRQRHCVIDALALNPDCAPEEALAQLAVAPVLAACAEMLQQESGLRRAASL